MSSLWLSMGPSCHIHSGKWCDISATAAWAHQRLAHPFKHTDGSICRDATGRMKCRHRATSAYHSLHSSSVCKAAEHMHHTRSKAVSAGMERHAESLPAAAISLAAQRSSRPCSAGLGGRPDKAREGVAASAGGGNLIDVFQAIQAQMEGMAASHEPPLADVEVSQMTFHPAGRHPASAHA